MIALSAGTARGPLRDRGNDLYETPECATLALLRVEQLPKRIWEPACGRGAIVRVLRGTATRSLPVISSITATRRVFTDAIFCWSISYRNAASAFLQIHLSRLPKNSLSTRSSFART